MLKKVFFDNALKENRGDLRNTWRIINELTSRKSKSTFVNEVIFNSGNSIHDPLELSEAFNDHFSNIGPRLTNEIFAGSERKLPFVRGSGGGGGGYSLIRG